MLISKFDLYKTEWLDLVFDDRNKDYGAYNLRQTYAGNMVRAMAITFITVGALLGASVVLHSKPVPVPIIPPDQMIKVVLNPTVKPLDPPKRLHEPVAPPKPPEVIKTTQFIQFVVKKDNEVDKNPPEITDLNKTAIGPATVDGKPGVSAPPPDVNPGNGGVAAPAAGNELVPLSGLDFMPEPVGGAGAWDKFLNKNLRFPAIAQDEGASGRVFMSFVIEKDGSLTNITVEKAAGHGFDEEATRVLKLAKAWKPGMQNGQPVRVRYMIPINFQAAE